VIPGSKATRADLVALRKAGWDIDILAHHRAGKPVLGICGGYQMLGRTISDPQGIEGDPGLSRGLALLDVETVLSETKQLRTEAAIHRKTGLPLAGYHMHMGVSTGPDTRAPFATIGTDSDGATSADGLVAGTYLHGIFADNAFRHAFLDMNSAVDYDREVDAALDGLARHLERHLDLDSLLSLAAAV
jgi:adenosylcobyric acid synthase